MTHPFDRIVILDDFYPDPARLRETALGKQYHKPPTGSGRLAQTAFCTEQETRAMCQQVAPYFPERDIVTVSVMFRYTLAGTAKKITCHVDGCAYAGIVYLTLPEHCAGGTTFYRHKPTGDVIYDEAHARQYNFRAAEQWEIAKQVDMAYNRLVFYPGQLFHSLTPVFFGDDINNARLTQNIFIYRPGDMALRQNPSPPPPP